MSDQVKRALDNDFMLMLDDLNLAFLQAVRRAGVLPHPRGVHARIDLAVVDCTLEGQTNIGLAIRFEREGKGHNDA